MSDVTIWFDGACPLFRPIGVAARVPPVLWLLEWSHLLFLRVRPRLELA